MEPVTWFRDYVYIPLGGNRGGQFATLRNLLIVFLLTGLWHGAAWTFVVWGALHGFYMVVEALIRRASKNRTVAQKSKGARVVQSALQVLLTFALVCFAWVFFRANTLSDAFYGLSHMFAGISSPMARAVRRYMSRGFLTSRCRRRRASTWSRAA